MVRVHVLIGYLVAGGVSDGVFFWSRLSLFALWEVLRSILKSVSLTPSFRVGIEDEPG